MCGSSGCVCGSSGWVCGSRGWVCGSSGCVCFSSLSTRTESCSMPVGAVTQSFLTLAGTIILSTTDINYPQ